MLLLRGMQFRCLSFSRIEIIPCRILYRGYYYNFNPNVIEGGRVRAWYTRNVIDRNNERRIIAL